MTSRVKKKSVSVFLIAILDLVITAALAMLFIMGL